MKLKTVTSEKALGLQPCPGKFTMTPSWLVLSPDLFLQMAEEKGRASGNIKMGNFKNHRIIFPTPRAIKSSTKEKKNFWFAVKNYSLNS